MSFGKLYGYAGNPRTNTALIIAKENNLELEIVETKPGDGVSVDYKKLNKLGKIPTFEGKDGFILSETIAIAVYFASQNEKTSLLGKTKQDYASILRWMSFANSTMAEQAAPWIRPVLGLSAFNKKTSDEAKLKTNDVAKVFDDHFLINTYLVGERITLADLFCAAFFVRGFSSVFDKQWRQEYPHVSRWAATIANQPVFKAIVPEFSFIDEALKPQTQPKKEAAPKKEQAKAAPKPAAANTNDDEEEDKPAPKAKHPLEELGRPTFALDDWKRKYKNEETREVALPWLWQNLNWEEYSLWAIDFKYNDELTMTFMSNNQIGGFFNRLEASRKYLMGCASVYGVANDSIIKGAFIVRGQEALPAFDVAPDWESYQFTKLDPSSAADKELVESMFAWDKPVNVNGKDYEWADGKVFV